MFARKFNVKGLQEPERKEKGFVSKQSMVHIVQNIGTYNIVQKNFEEKKERKISNKNTSYCEKSQNNPKNKLNK